jgi:hypothetical protein
VTCAGQFLHEAFDFAGVMRMGGVAGTHTEEKFPVCHFGELDAANAEAEAAIVLGDPFDFGEVRDVLPGVDAIRSGSAAGLQAGVEVAMITRVDADDVVTVIKDEDFEAGRRWVEAEDTQRGGAFLAVRKVHGEALYGDAGFTITQISEPDQAESENIGMVGIGRAGDGGPTVLAVFEERTWEGGGEAVLEGSFGGDLGERPFWELATQEETESLAEYESAAALAHFRTAAFGEVEEKELTLASREALDRKFEAGVGGVGCVYDAAGPIAGTVPGLEREARAAHFKGVVIRGQGE